MTLARHLVLLLAAALLAVALGMMPSVASAHPGHVQLGHDQAAPPGSTVKPSPALMQRTDAASRTAHPSLGAPVAKTGTLRASDLRCGGPCCVPNLHVSSCCCGTALAPHAEATVPAPDAAVPGRRRDSTDPTGIDPETLPEPPKPFA